MKGGHQWRSLAAGREIAAAKIGYHVDAQALGDDVRIPDLQRKWRLTPRLMQHGLAVAADCTHGARGQLIGPQQLFGGACEFLGRAGVELAELDEADVLVVLGQAAQAPLQRCRPFAADRGAQMHAEVIDLEQRGIDAVHASAGHQTEVEAHARP
jgi:hypothetical protein